MKIRAKKNLATKNLPNKKNPPISIGGFFIVIFLHKTNFSNRIIGQHITKGCTMWEWSNRTKNSKYGENASLIRAYDDITPQDLPTHFSKENEQNIPSVSEMQEIVLSLLAHYNLKQMYLLKKDYTPQTWKEMSSIFTEYQRARKAFLKLIAYSNIKECIKLGLDDEDISQLKIGITPENYNTHLKLPFDFGGNLNFNNFSLIKTHHTHSDIHRIMDYQIGCGFLLKYKKIFIPYFDGKFYYD